MPPVQEKNGRVGSPSSQSNSVTKSVEKAQERKESSIKSFQAGKEESIKIASSGRDAAMIVAAKLHHRDLPDEEIEKSIKKWSHWFYTNVYDVPFR